MPNIKRANTSGVTKSGVAIADVPDAPTIGSATATGSSTATVAYTAATTGGTATTFTATSTPGSITGTGSSPITVSGLTAETSYTFTVRASNSTGNSPFSSASNSITTPSALAYESISTVTVGAGGTSAITFSSIPSTFKHLQIRGIAHGNTAGDQDLFMQVGNGSVQEVNYSWKSLHGTGSTNVNASSGGSGANYIVGGYNFAIGTGTPNVFSSIIVDILDYSNTNKKKTVRSLAGVDKNGSGTLGLFSGIQYDLTSAINIITLYPSSGGFSQYSHFALYGIKG